MPWKNLNILFKFPARKRKDKFLSTLNKYYELMVDKENFQFLISIDEDDHELLELDLSNVKNLKVCIGPSMGKIHAINRDMDKIQDFDVVVLVSDDMVPVLKGFDMHIRKDMFKNFPDTDGVLWYNDGHQKNNLNTLCILGKKYYRHFNYIYHPDYTSLWCDNEFTEVSKKLGKVVYKPLTIIEHQHWAWGYGEMDELYQENEKYLSADREVFLKRKAKNFDIK